MARSSWKFVATNKLYWALTTQIELVRKLASLRRENFFDSDNLNKKIKFFTEGFKRKIDSRYLPITKSLTRTTVFVHKGFVYKKLYLSSFLIGCKLGEFSITRKPFKYPIKKKKKNFLRR